MYADDTTQRREVAGPRLPSKPQCNQTPTRPARSLKESKTLSSPRVGNKTRQREQSGGSLRARRFPELLTLLPALSGSNLFICISPDLFSIRQPSGLTHPVASL